MTLGASFRVGDYAKKLSENVLREARAEHDVLIEEKKDTPPAQPAYGANAGRNGAPNSGYKPSAKCYNCGAYGHYADKCWKRRKF